MGFSGATHPIIFNTGGFSGNQNKDGLPDTAMLPGSKNINLHKGGREKRGGCSKVYADPVTDYPLITGVFNFEKTNGSHFLVFTTSDGKIYNAPSTVLKSGLTVDRVSNLVPYLDTLYINNGANITQKWDGVAGATSNLTNLPADWSAGHPTQMIVHGRGNSLRLFALGVLDFEENLYVSAEGNDNFGGSPLVFNIETGDLYGLRGGVEFGNRLVLFSKNKAFIFNDEDTSSANWGYDKAQWDGGVASWRLIVRLPNDILCMTEDGEIYSVTAAQSYGDYKAASVSRPSFINQWIADNVDLTLAKDQFHAVFDPALRAVKIFVVRQGEVNIDTALIYFIDRNPAEAWSVHDIGV